MKAHGEVDVAGATLVPRAAGVPVVGRPLVGGPRTEITSRFSRHGDERQPYQGLADFV
jgi:hypothetical protein